MAANFALAAADIVIEADGVETDRHERVQINVRNGRARLDTDRGEPIIDRLGVLTSTRLSRNAWAVTFTDGSRWDVARNKAGCKKCG